MKYFDSYRTHSYYIKANQFLHNFYETATNLFLIIIYALNETHIADKSGRPKFFLSKLDRFHALTINIIDQTAKQPSESAVNVY